MRFMGGLLCVTALMVGILASGCSTTGPDDPGGGGFQADESYFGTTPDGHNVTLQIDHGKRQYSFYNETTGSTVSGTYTISSDPNYGGAYITSNDEFIIEVPGELFMTTVPLGGSKSFGLTFGLTSGQNLNNANVLGNYLFLGLGSDGVNSWGGFALNAGGTFTYGFAPKEEVTSPFNYFQGDGGGTWQVAPGDSSRLEFAEGSYIYYGSVLPGKLIVLNHPEGGYVLGIKYPSSPVPFNQIAGTYTCIDYERERNDVGIGWYQLPAYSAPFSWYLDYRDYGVVSGTSTNNLQQHPYINLGFTVEEDSWILYCLVLPGNVILHWRFSDQTWDDLLGNGAGAMM